MTFSEWLDSLPDDEREALACCDAWNAGAIAMLDALVERGFISSAYIEDAKKATADITESISTSTTTWPG